MEYFTRALKLVRMPLPPAGFPAQFLWWRMVALSGCRATRHVTVQDPHYLSACTLMGHEYVEMKNTPAAIQAYRRAVDINPRSGPMHLNNVLPAALVQR